MVLLGATASPHEAQARPTAVLLFCAQYPEAPACAAGVPACSLCHVSTDVGSAVWNDYGEDLRAVLGAMPDFDAELPAALVAVEPTDSDLDGFDNLTEIAAGSLPGDPVSAPADITCPDDVSGLPWTICSWDAVWVRKKIALDFCGHSPTFEELEEFRALSDDARLAELDDVLDACLQTSFWRGRDGVLWQLAYPKVRPVGALKSGKGASPIESIRIADYDNDLALYAWAQLDDHDARDVILADYYVAIDGDAYTEVPNIGTDELTACTDASQCGGNQDCVCEQGLVELDDGSCGCAGLAEDIDGTCTCVDAPSGGTPCDPVQPRRCECVGACLEAVEVDRRRGLLTTRWTLLYTTMFSALPRATAAQAYRAFLGLDIAKQEGLQSVDAEPVDYDEKGVGAAQCEVCHATLDPLTYPFTRYQGFGPNRASYFADRMSGPQFADEGENIAATPEAGVLLGQPVADLREWAAIAADSPEFARAAVGDYWELLIGPIPTDDGVAELVQLADDFRNPAVHAYSVESMLHALIRTEAYGTP